MSTTTSVRILTIGLAFTAIQGCSATTDIAQDSPMGRGQALTGEPEIVPDYDASAACKRYCGYAEECGTGQLPVPNLACDCVGPDCDCATEEECVDECLGALGSIDEEGLHCAGTVKRTLACLQTAACAPLRDVGGQAWFDDAGCDDVVVPSDLQDACPGYSHGSFSDAPMFSSCSAGGTALTDEQIASMPLTIPHCALQVACSDNRYGLSCDRIDAEENLYRCSCTDSGTTTSSYEQVNGCDWENDGSLGSPEKLIQDRCHFAANP